LGEQKLVKLSTLLRLLNEIPAYRELTDALTGSPPRLPEGPIGLLSTARPTVLAALHAHSRRPMLVVAARADRARDLTRQIRAWSPFPAAVLRLPDPDALPYERVAWGRDTIRERVSALAALSSWPVAQGSENQRGRDGQGDLNRNPPP
jgi:hypothetical protein